MFLQLRDANNLINTDFGKWLVPYVQQHVHIQLKNARLSLWDKYITESKVLDKLYTSKKYNAKDIIIFAAKNLECIGVDGTIQIRINPNKMTPGFNQTRADLLAKMINYGTLDCAACPVFTDAFESVADNIDMYIRMYYGIL